MPLRVYNTLTGTKDDFEPVQPGKVGMYLCGPTVYKPPHIGHMVGPVIFDAIKRFLVHQGFAVTWVINVTDVDDKIIDESKRRAVTFDALAKEQTQLYLSALERFGIKSAVDHFPMASEHMPEIISMISRLIETKHAYSTSHGDVWFDSASDPDYGKLSNRKLNEQEAGLRDLAGAGKRAAADFALWKSAKPDEPAWDSPWGRGRPGWHIECSAMSIKYLGETFDIHGGGDDLKFPHHENEIAQSECYTGKTFAKYWLHNGLTRIRTKASSGEWKAEKMSKSLGNTVGAHDLLAAHGPHVLRYLLLSTHYRSPIEFGDEALATATKALTSFQRLIEERDRVRPNGGAVGAEAARSIDSLEQLFMGAMEDDFNTGAAIGVLNKLANAARTLQLSERDGAATFIAHVDRIEKLFALLGLSIAPEKTTGAGDGGKVIELLNKLRTDGVSLPIDPATVPTDIEGAMQTVIQLRNDSRKAKNFALADGIRKGLTEIGITLEDRAGGTIWRKV